MDRLTHRAATLLASGTFALVVAVLLAISARLNGGRIVFVADDPYIHMAMAKNLVRHGEWGVTGGSFSSTSSSPLWTCMLAAAYLGLGVGEAAPLLLNVLFGILAVVVVGRMLEREGVSPRWTLAVSLVVVTIVPLPTIALCGMEHTLQIVLALAFAMAAAEAAAGEPEASTGAPFRLALLLAVLLVGARYEGLFLVGVAAALLALKRRFTPAVAVVAAGTAPAAAYGAVSLAHGWYALPNSVLLKGHAPAAWSASALGGYAASGLERLVRSPELAALALAAVVILVVGRRRRGADEDRHRAVLLIFLGALAAHAVLAATNYRYEAYLVALGIVACAAGARPLVAGRGGAAHGRARRSVTVAAAVAVVVVAVPLAARGARATAITVRASRNIYEQQVQMGLFLRRFHPGGAVAVNDIGAVSYFADVRLLDLWGLASLDVARARRGVGLSAAVVDRLAAADDVRVAVLYEEWYAGVLPRRWVRAGTWRIPDNVVCGGDTVTFFATSPEARDGLVQALREFSPELPAEVVASPGIAARAETHAALEEAAGCLRARRGGRQLENRSATPTTVTSVPTTARAVGR
ncbi:MAG TPA: hypothetical protein VMT19_01580 [Thermoanaerobaculaceae bacterium]|nr:hypothetical protein [Thermoanaerobaculaceae bacterium]